MKDCNLPLLYKLCEIVWIISIATIKTQGLKAKDLLTGKCEEQKFEVEIVFLK